MQKYLNKLFRPVAVLLSLIGCAVAAEEGDLRITQAWTRATLPAAKVAAGYVTIENQGSEPDRLVAVEADFSDAAEIHEMTMKDGVMKMRPLAEGLDIPPGQSVALEPGGYHLMFMGLEQPLVQGETVDMTLMFEQAGRLEISLSVAAMGASEPPAEATP